MNKTFDIKRLYSFPSFSSLDIDDEVYNRGYERVIEKCGSDRIEIGYYQGTEAADMTDKWYVFSGYVGSTEVLLYFDVENDDEWHMDAAERLRNELIEYLSGDDAPVNC